MCRALWQSIPENGFVDRHQPARDVDNCSRAPVIVLQVDHALGLERKIFLEAQKDFWIRAGPGINRLLVVADREDVTVIAGELTNDSVLDRIQILELVHEHSVVSRPNLLRDGIHPEQLCCFEDEAVEISDVLLRHHPAITVVVLLVATPQWGSAKAITRESVQKIVVKTARSPQAAQHRLLVLFVGDAESYLQSDVLTELAQQLGAETMNSAAPHALDTITKLALETVGDLASSLVREREDTDPGGIDSYVIDEETDPLDQAKRLPSAGPRKQKQRPGLGFDCRALISGGDARNWRGAGGLRRHSRAER